MSRRVLVLCASNPAPAQMAGALWQTIDEERNWVVDAGSLHPELSLDPAASAVMAEVQIDLATQSLRHVDKWVDDEFDLVVTLCKQSEETCPQLAGAAHHLHWPCTDPQLEQLLHEDPQRAYRELRDSLSRRIREYLDADASDEEFLDRDLSWLEFNRRVLHEAGDQRNPLLERLLFLGIFTSNLDEFFMKRVGRLVANGKSARPSDSKRARLNTLRETILPMLDEQARLFRDEIRAQLAESGVQLLNWTELTDDEQQRANAYFRSNVFPVLTPQAVDPSHPFPFISNLSDSLAVALRYPESDRKWFARVKVPHQLPQWIELNTENPKVKRFASLREIIIHNLAGLFPGMNVDDVLPLRVTRSANVEEDFVEADDLLVQVEEELRKRRLQQVVRLEHAAQPNRWLLDQVVAELDLLPEQIYELSGELDYTDFMSVVSLPLSEHRFSDWKPVIPPALRDTEGDIFKTIRGGDLLVHLPYESFDASVANFIRTAVEDPDVLAIKMTLYRTSDDTPFIPWLIQAAEEGKQVACLVELKARFDEHRNIRWANALEDAGVHVVYGVIGKKTHTKTALVVRREGETLRCYAHVGTGNYHPKTARLYTDLGLFTCQPEVTEDVVELFHYLTGRSLKQDYRRLLVAPVNMKERFLSLIQREADHARQGRPAHIIAKMNQLEDRDLCRALYQASQAGVAVDLIVRGFCVLRPGVAELSPTIRVLSIIGRFLEHSRVYYFRNGAEDERDGEFLIGSADWMYRNLEERVEAVVPVHDAPLRHRLWDILQVMLMDHRQAWIMNPDGSYQQRQPGPETTEDQAMGTHALLMRRTLES